VLEEEDKRCGLEEGDVRAEELGFAEFGWSMGWRLCGRMSRRGIDRGCHLGY